MNISTWIELRDITKEEIQRAKDSRKSIDKSRGRNIFESKGRWIGEDIGEGRFEEWLIKIKIVNQRNKEAHAPYDFIVNYKTIDVKTNENDWHPTKSPDTYRFLVDKSQVDKGTDIDYYVSLMIHENKIWFCGFVSRAKLLTYPKVRHNTLSCAIPFLHLDKPREFKQKMLELKDPTISEAFGYEDEEDSA